VSAPRAFLHPIPLLIAGVILAAGRSSRMGSSKALLTFGDETFLSRIARAMREGGCSRIIVVVGPAEGPESPDVASVALGIGADAVINPDRESEQIESLRLGLRHLDPETECVLVTPVDAPGASRAVVRSLVAAVRAGAPIAVPSYAGRRGHPVAFGQEVLAELMWDELPEGARSVIRRHEDRVAHIDADDSDVLLDVDTPGDYARLKKGG
jgi:molybdenum cofactor cytidylyltransferase